MDVEEESLLPPTYHPEKLEVVGFCIIKPLFKQDHVAFRYLQLRKVASRSLESKS
jgi:hypothetical protein